MERYPKRGDRVEFIEPLERAGPRLGTVTGIGSRTGYVYVLWDGLTRTRPQAVDLLQFAPSEQAAEVDG